jgi:phosphatidylserine/phosphatidylglycerophosphate/cardiolipin synthase-like enzyme
MYEIQSPEVNPHRSSPPGTPGADKQAKIAANLIDLAKRGVKVKVILDNSYDDQKKEYHNEAMIEHLRSNGVEVITYPRTAAEISHVKLLIVDGKFAVIGGMNWGNHSAVNHDACVLLEGDDVGNLAEQIFKVDYEFSGGDAATLPPHRTIPEERIKVLTTAPCGSPCGGNNEIYEQILQRIDGAQHSIVAQLFVLTDKTVAQKLKEAHERMIAAGTPGVQILVDPGLYLKFKNCRKMVDQLHQDGVPIRFYKSNWADEQKLHGKWAVFDEQELLIGSANWSKVGLQSNCPTNISFNSQNQFEKGNHEANVAIQSKQLCKAFLRQFAYDWEKRSFTVEGGFKSILQTIPFNLRDQILGPRKPKPAPAAEVPPAPAPDAPAPDNVVPMPTPPTKRRKTEG